MHSEHDHKVVEDEAPRASESFAELAASLILYITALANVLRTSPLWQAYPNKKELANAIKGRLRTAAGKKKLSPLKKLILRERADKAVDSNKEALAAARSTLQGMEEARASVQATWKVALSHFQYLSHTSIQWSGYMQLTHRQRFLPAL